MVKIIFTLFILSGFIFSSEIKQHYSQKVDPNQKIEISYPTKQLPKPELPKKTGRHELGRTWYDYTDNVGRTIAHALDSNDGQDGIHFVFMKRQPDAAGNRYVTYDYWDLNLGLFYGNQSITEIQPTGYGKIVNGFNDEVFCVMHGGGVHLYQDTGEANYSFVNIFSRSNGIYASIDRVGNLIVMSAGDSLYHSTDNGLNWISTQLPSLASYYPLNPQINPANTNEISFLETDSPYLKKWTTTNLGVTWTYEIIYDQTTTNPDGSVYLITNFQQHNNYIYTQDSTFHVVSNGYGLNADSSDNIFPIIYWNSRDRQWLELTDAKIGRPTDTTITQILANNRPGNGIGNAYPHISEGPNGELVVIWQQWEDDGTGMPVVVTPSGGSPVYCTDIWGAWTVDLGRHWTESFYLSGTTGQSDVYPNITKQFFHNQQDDSVYFDIMYLWDTNAGVSLFAGGNDASECVWYYERCSLEFYTDIESENVILGDQFILQQNYPNPFNPTTTIKYELPKTSKVRIEIFDILGRSVKTLINSKQNLGAHEILWNGLNNAGKSVSGGIYFYQLKTDNYSQTKKMLFLK
jgi:hypothetical protein